MKRLLLLVVPLFLFCWTAQADEMVVHLQSGNDVLIEYTGTINRVTIKGDSDAITGMQMKHTTDKVIAAEPAGHVADKTVKGEKEKGSKVKFRWAKPLDEENLKKIRSGSR